MLEGLLRQGDLLGRVPLGAVDRLGHQSLGDLPVEDRAEQGGEQEALSAEALEAKVAAFVRQNPDVPVYVAGDRDANYEVVLRAMVLLQNADVPRVGLMSAPSEAVQQ